MFKKIEAWLDRLRRWFFLLQFGQFAWPIIAGIIGAVVGFFGGWISLTPTIAALAQSVGVGAIIFLFGLAVEVALGKLRLRSLATPPSTSTSNLPGTPSGQGNYPSILIPEVTEAERRIKGEEARLLTLAADQQNNWGKYICGYMKAVDFDGIDQNEASVTATMVLVNRTVFEVSATEFEINNSTFWISHQKNGNLRALTSSHQSAVIAPGMCGEFKHEFPLSTATAEMLREFHREGTEVHFDIYPSWKLRFSGVDQRWQTRTPWVEKPRRSWERQQ